MNVIKLIGNTPLVHLKQFCPEGFLFAKLESRNPGFSIKDRIALSMVEDAEQQGLIKPGDVIVEPTSGNTGIGLAMVGRIKGYKVVLTMPETMSLERRAVLRMLGAKIRLSAGHLGIKGAIELAKTTVAELKGWSPGQFDNPANPAIHYRSTGPEIFTGADGHLDFFVAGVGTGGTITGAGRYLKEKLPSIRLIAVEPAASPVLSGGTPGSHPIQGIGPGFIPSVLDINLLDAIETVEGEEAFETARELAAKEGLLVGISSGANLAVARRVIQSNPGARVATILCDAGERYLSTVLYTELTCR